MERSFAIEAVGLEKVFADGTVALRGVDLHIPYGTVFAYLGRNGSGKTTTVRILTTLTRASAGTARVAGHDVDNEPEAVRALIGVTMQSAALDPEMTGRSHLRFVAEAWGRSPRQARREADAVLADLGLTEAAERAIGSYSGGMARRLDLASALLNGPRVLFLDEPTTGLDAQSRRALWERVRALRDGGTAVFLTTQYLEEAEALADLVAVLHEGRIVAEGRPREIREGEDSLEDAFLRLTADDPEMVTTRGGGA